MKNLLLILAAVASLTASSFVIAKNPPAKESLTKEISHEAAQDDAKSGNIANNSFEDEKENIKEEAIAKR